MRTEHVPSLMRGSLLSWECGEREGERGDLPLYSLAGRVLPCARASLVWCWTEAIASAFASLVDSAVWLCLVVVSFRGRQSPAEAYWHPLGLLSLVE